MFYTIHRTPSPRLVAAGRSGISLLTEIGLTAGPRSPAVADGYWIMLAPLPPGDHRVRILAERQDESTLDVTWTLEIAQ
jgi:hypothetical protein